jgi:cell division protein FtsQ
LEKLRTMDADAYPQEALADEEPKYLRRQKPLEIKRRKFGRKAWKTYMRVAVWLAAGFVSVWIAYTCAHFLLASREMALIHSDQVELTGNHYVTRANVLEIFAADRNRSVLRAPLDERRRQLEAIPWVEQATVRRALPNKIEVEIVERVPIAFLRQGNEPALLDIHGVILEKPVKGDFHFPVVTGISADMTPEEREKRMQLFAGFTQQVESARAGAMNQVSEIDLAEAHDLRATISGLNGAGVSSGTANSFQPDSPILVHFGDSDFEVRYRTLLENIGQWRATAGRVESVDLRFNREAVVNPEMAAVPRQVAQQQMQQQPRALPKQLHAAGKSPKKHRQ